MLPLDILTSWCCLAIFSSSSFFFLALSLSIFASAKLVMKWSKMPKNSSDWVVVGSSQNILQTRSNLEKWKKGF